VAAYGANFDCIKPEERRLLRTIDLGFEAGLSVEHIRAIQKLAIEPITIAEIADAVSTDRGLAAVSHVDVEKTCDYFCRTPFRVLATVS
jgi:hypothetical protein